MNGNEINAGQEKYDAALENPSQTISSGELNTSADSAIRLRFLPHMMVMVKDSAMSYETPGLLWLGWLLPFTTKHIVDGLSADQFQAHPTSLLVAQAESYLSGTIKYIYGAKDKI